MVYFFYISFILIIKRGEDVVEIIDSDDGMLE
jgi:hypothetical protein